MRTNVEIDDELMTEALAIGDARTKREVIDEALKAYIRLKRQRSLLSLYGSVPDWQGNLDEMRRDR